MGILRDRRHHSSIPIPALPPAHQQQHHRQQGRSHQHSSVTSASPPRGLSMATSSGAPAHHHRLQQTGLGSDTNTPSHSAALMPPSPSSQLVRALGMSAHPHASCTSLRVPPFCLRASTGAGPPMQVRRFLPSQLFIVHIIACLHLHGFFWWALRRMIPCACCMPLHVIAHRLWCRPPNKLLSTCINVRYLTSLPHRLHQKSQARAYASLGPLSPPLLPATWWHAWSIGPKTSVTNARGESASCPPMLSP